MGMGTTRVVAEVIEMIFSDIESGEEVVRFPVHSPEIDLTSSISYTYKKGGLEVMAQSSIEYWDCIIKGSNGVPDCLVIVKSQALAQFLTFMATAGYYVKVEKAIVEERI